MPGELLYDLGSESQAGAERCRDNSQLYLNEVRDPQRFGPRRKHEAICTLWQPQRKVKIS